MEIWLGVIIGILLIGMIYYYIKHPYHWYNAEFKKKHSMYSYVMVIFLALTVACLLWFPQNIKMLNLLFIAVGVVCWYMAYSIQNKDKQLRAFAQTKKVEAK